MSVSLRARAWVLAFALGLSALALTPSARAGTLRVVDETHQLGPADLQALSGVVARAPFDARLVVTTDYADAQDLARYVHTLVTSPSLVVVGLDPVHRHVQVRFGVESGVPRAQWADVERAGNDAFRRGDWAGGASAIFETAARSAAASPLANPDGRAPSRDLAPAERPSMFGSTFLVLAVLGVVVAGLYFVSRRRDGRGGYPDGYGPPGGYGPGPTGYGPGGGYYGGGYAPPGGGMGPLGGGLLGAGLGGLAGYELGKAAGERDERDREDRGYDRGTDRGDAGGDSDDYDAGGGGSSWDDGGGGSDGGGFDGGGSDGGGSDF